MINCEICQVATSSFLEIGAQLANILIAFFALFFSIYIYFATRKSDEQKDRRNREVESFKTLVLQHNLVKLFSFYEEIRASIKPLSTSDLGDVEKQTINDQLQDHLKMLRYNFIDLLLAIDRSVYVEIKKHADDLVDLLTKAMFDEGINLSHPPQFDDKIEAPMSESKTQIIKTLYDLLD